MTDFYRLNIDDALAELHSEANTGLNPDEVVKRQTEHGKNVLPTEAGEGLLKLLISQFMNIMVIILIVAAVVSLALGDVKDVIVIMLIVIANALLGTYQERQAEQALAALSAMQVPLVRVRRESNVHQVSAEELVPGDIVLLQEGDRVPADGRLIESANLQLIESALTGESQAVDKNIESIPGNEQVGVGDRTNMAFMGTAVNYGRGVMVVTEIGLKTQLGKIAAMLMGVEKGETPLQRRLNALGETLVKGAVAIVVVVFIAGLLRGIPIQEMLLTSISLAVAAVPEGLPAIITIALSLGAARMVRRNALIRRLPAVETLGSVTVICSDKTGTLTKNEMTATLLMLPGHDDVTVTGVGYKSEGEFQRRGIRLDPRKDPTIERFLKVMALSTDAYLEKAGSEDNFKVVGDTTEGALLVAAQKVGWTRQQIESDLPRIGELPFSSDRKAMTTIHSVQNANDSSLFCDCNVMAVTKGAPDRLIEWATHEHMPAGPRLLTDEHRQGWFEQVDKMAAQGLRVLGLAYRPLNEIPKEIDPNVERELYLLGLIGILDPARPEAKEAVKTARAAGIRTVMITGDHALTAEAIARDLGILEAGQNAVTGAQLDKMNDAEWIEALKTTSAFARVSPEHKLRLVKVLQGQKEVVAMTGDGVNDAPALKQADIGVAMGITGTDVSKGASEMVLTDDNFASIVAAVEEGRVIYDNIRKFVRYLLSSNIGEVMVMFVALMIGLKIPMLAIQILWVNLVTDGLPAIALGFEPAEPDVMQRKPRPPQESIFARGMGQRIIWFAVVLAVVTLAAYAYGYLVHKMDPLSQTLALEHLSRADLVEVVGESYVPANWDALSQSQRGDLLKAAENTEGKGGGAGDILDMAERVPRTIAFTVLALGQIFHVSAIHAGEQTSFFRVWFKKNRFMFWAVILTFGLQLAVIYVPFLQATFETQPLSWAELAISLALASVLLFAVEIEKAILNRRNGQVAI